MKRHVSYRIGGKYGYYVYMDVETKKVLQVHYEDPRSGGMIGRSYDGIKEPESALEEVKKREPNVWNKIQNIKNGTEDFLRYAWFDENGVQVTSTFEKWELDYPCNQNLNDEYKKSNLHIQQVPYKNDLSNVRILSYGE